MLRSVSHELRTPLNAITFFTNEIVQESTNINEEERKKLKMVSISSKLVLSLIDDLLDYSKIISGVFTVNKSACDIKRIIENTCELISFQASKKNLSLNIRIDPNIPISIYTDSLRFSQILLNLLSNSLKFTVKGHIEVCCILAKNCKLKCYVEDTGQGMTETVKRKLFTEFSTSNTQNLNPQGSGLGLCIANILALELGGKPIKVIRTEIGKGSTFKFTIKISNNVNNNSKQDEYDEIADMPEIGRELPVNFNITMNDSD